MVKIKCFKLLLLLAVGHTLVGQKLEKIFYDKEWKGCNESKAFFYRIVTVDDNGKPMGKVLDYYITGELQSEAEGALSVNKIDDKYSVLVGKTIGYYKSGKKNFEHVRDFDGKEISNTHWYENGNKKFEVKYKNEKYDGLYTSYYENGQIKFQQEYQVGKPVDKWALECDEFGKCQNVFFDYFKTDIDENGWDPADNEKYKSQIIAEKGFLMKNKTDIGYAQWIHIPIDIINNFSIETIIDFKDGSKNTGHGLIYGYKDWNNYYYFFISANGQYKIGAKTDGINLEYAKWTPSNYINQNEARNLIKINKIKDKVYFSINGQIVSSENFYAFAGNNVGFYIPSGKKEVLFERLVIRQDVNKNEANTNSVDNSDWKGNGSGFFIDTRGYIATNFHVVDGSKQLLVEFYQNGKKISLPAKIISTDKQNDLAIIKIEDSNFKPILKLPYNYKQQISDVGSSVFAMGYPMAHIMGQEVKFTDGKISSKTGFQGDITTYQISVPVQPGNSGGPLFDYDGNIIGIVNAKITEADNVSYAIKSTYLKNLTDVLPESMNLPSDITISSKTLTEKIKILSDFVVLIKIK